MKMLMRIGVVQGEPCGTESLKLCGHFSRELALCAAIHREIDAGQNHVRAKPARSFDKIRHRMCRKRGDAVHQHEMQPDSKPGKAARSGHGIGSSRARHHQAGGRQYAIAMGLFNRFIHFRRGAEIIRRDDQLFQAWLRRARRKWKNSTPSRSRRFIISGLATISATIEAIFEGRK